MPPSSLAEVLKLCLSTYAVQLWLLHCSW
jgi:hypothetical protein